MFKTPTFEQIRDTILRDTKSIWPSADVSEDSDHFVHASRLASCAMGQYAHQHWIARQIFPDTADSDYLERHAAMRGIYRRNPTAATGETKLTGIAGSQIAAGLQIRAGSRLYQVRFAGEISANGVGRVRIMALESGAAANTNETSAEMMAAPIGVSSDCTVSAEGGTDGESDASLLARLLEILRRPPAGGNKYDYRNWALSVDGVTAAYVHPLRRGLGTVDVVITSENGLPSDETIKKVQDYIDDVRPVTAKNVAVLKPDITALTVEMQVKVDGVALESVKERIKVALTEYFDSLIPGDSVIVSKIEAAISNTDGVIDRKLVSPAANLAADTSNKVEWYKLGNLVITKMV